METGHNPFAPPTADVGFVDATADIDDDAERVRRELLQHEAAIRGLGLLSYLVAAGIALAVLSWLVYLRSRALAGIVSFSGLGVGIYYLGRGLRRFEPWARPPSIMFALIGLTAFPMGTLVSAYILYLVAGAKGKRVLSRPYQEIVRRTPHIPVKTSVAFAVFASFVFCLYVFGFGLAWFSAWWVQAG